MRQLALKPQIHKYERCAEFVTDFQIGKGDLIITNEFIFNPFFGSLPLEADVLFQEKYGAGEPSDEMAETIYADIMGSYKRIIAIGGGTVIDLAKLYVLKNVTPIIDLFDRKLDLVKDKELIIVPTTCGTGSEVTNISILELKSRQTKLGLAVDELYADSAVMIPELLSSLPYEFFATSSIDALIHAVESCVSPKATLYTRMFAYKAIQIIVSGYQVILKDGKGARTSMLEDFLTASNLAGIAFGNAGVGAVHAMSYPLGGKYHVAHGEANYALFTRVFDEYMSISHKSPIAELNCVLAESLGCAETSVYTALAELLDTILPLKRLREYGVTEDDIPAFTANVVEKQGRLTANNFMPLDAGRIATIYRDLL
jgi:4-hydroxybutyrate dehydrogenase